MGRWVAAEGNGVGGCEMGVSPGWSSLSSLVFLPHFQQFYSKWGETPLLPLAPDTLGKFWKISKLPKIGGSESEETAEGG